MKQTIEIKIETDGTSIGTDIYLNGAKLENATQISVFLSEIFIDEITEGKDTLTELRTQKSKISISAGTKAIITNGRFYLTPPPMSDEEKRAIGENVGMCLFVQAVNQAVNKFICNKKEE